MYDYAAEESNEISFVEGERLHSIKFEDENWWSATNQAGEIGLFPAASILSLLSDEKLNQILLEFCRARSLILHGMYGLVVVV